MNEDTECLCDNCVHNRTCKYLEKLVYFKKDFYDTYEKCDEDIRKIFKYKISCEYRLGREQITGYR